MRGPGSQSIKISENLARLGAFAGGDIPALLEDVKDASRPGVTETEPRWKAKCCFFPGAHFEICRPISSSSLTPPLLKSGARGFVISSELRRTLFWGELHDPSTSRRYEQPGSRIIFPVRVPISLLLAEEPFRAVFVQITRYQWEELETRSAWRVRF